MGASLEIADIISSEISAGEVRLDLGDARDGTIYAQRAAFWSMGGFIHRPLDRNGDGAAQALFLIDGQTKRVLQVRDNRYAKQAGNLDPGDSALVADGPARILLKHKRKAGTIYTEGSQGAIMVDCDGENGKLQLVCGPAFIEMKDADGGSIVACAAGNSITIDKDGITINGKHFACATGTGALGAKAPPPTGAPTPASVLAGLTAVAGAPSKNWTIDLG